MNNVIEKIRKLLAKVEGNNEHEAQAALLMARKLMARYKIDESALQEAEPRKNELNKIVFQDDYYTGKHNPWFLKLSQVIAENHCCGRYANKVYHSSKCYTVFAGLDDDPAIAHELFRYAVQHIQAQIAEYSRYIRSRNLYPKEEVNERVHAWGDSYAAGFIEGLAAKYDEQAANDETGSMELMIVKPKEVNDFISSLKIHSFRVSNYGENTSAKSSGYKAGYSFNPTKQISQA